jgi:hypothetical protein
MTRLRILLFFFRDCLILIRQFFVRPVKLGQEPTQPALPVYFQQQSDVAASLHFFQNHFESHTK